MKSQDLIRLLVRESIRSSTYETRSGKSVEYGSEAHVEDLRTLINELQRVKQTLKSGPDRHKNRKEIDRIQKAIEAMRFLKRKAKRRFDRNLLVTD
tara:strand:+ start:177 stop:464 length:288 start_codon:yes stop_codon:yes gene_type:complete